jgi:hypothetical protein
MCLSNLYSILFMILVALIIIYAIMPKAGDEYYKALQYYVYEDDAMNSNNVQPRIESCIKYCGDINKNEKDIAQCTTYCVNNSGYSPSNNYLYPDMMTLVNMM